MKDKKGKFILPLLPCQSSVFILVCLGGILAFVFLGILPDYNKLKRLDTDIKTAKTKLNEQKLLAPLYQKLLARMKLEGVAELPLPEKKQLKLSDIDSIPVIFREIAESSRLMLEQSEPDINSMENDADLLMVNLSAQGNYFDCRNFLIKIGEVPYLDRIESIQIHSNNGLKLIRIKLWLEINKA